ncbi:IclR family transcriptional regulator [Deinococcus sp. S9]|uniref:IclR family transcriptional regulator n=1 Tax=Deinococcus sp. S9 TaxID=2545754 RepID=UPI0010546ADD|nr:helix-turn-helix domain-containing protein [Deinococcus sp. S9]TDE85652.1 IclR family transcriptional regulator [Deinococcus sp. S9]
MLGTIERAGQVLALFTAERPEWGVSEVARELDLGKTRTHALLSSLAHVGLLHRMQTGRYRLGFRVLALSRVLLAHTPWREVAAEEMRVLAARVGGHVGLMAFDGLELVTLAEVPGTRPQERVAPQNTAAGRVMLAHRSFRTVQAVLAAHPGQATASSLEELAADLKTVRRLGVAILMHGPDSQRWEIAAPIRNHTGEVIAALNLSVAAPHFAQDGAVLQREVMASAALISTRIGYDGPSSFPRRGSE